MSNSSFDSGTSPSVSPDRANSVANLEGSRAHILVVSSDPEISSALVRLLGGIYEISTADQSRSAIELALRKPADLVFLVVNGREQEPFSAARLLRANQPTSTLPLLLISRAVDEAIRVEAYKAGIDGCIQYPFSDQELSARVSSQIALGRLRAADAQRERHLRLIAEEENRSWRYLLEQTPALMAKLTGPSHVYTMANEAYLRATGRETAQEVIGKPIREALPEMEGQGILEILDNVYRTSQPYVGNEVPVLLNRTGRPEKLYFNFVYQPEHDDEGHVQGILVQALEVTTQVEARHRLEASEKRLTAIFEQASVGICEADLNGRFVLANQRFCDIVGRSLEEVYRLGISDITHPDDIAENLRLFNGLVTTGRPYSLEKRYIRPDGSAVWVLVSVSLVRDEAGAPQYSLGIIQDIAARRHAEAELRRVNEDLRQFAFAASHDLQEPLRMVTSYTQLLLKSYAGKFDENAETFARFIRDGAGRMRDLLHDLLAYTAITGVDETSEPVDCNRVLKNVLGILQPAIEENGATIRAGQLPILIAQEPHIAQVFQNLISNALKYRSREPPVIEISARLSGNHWIFGFRDNGIGIDRRYHEKIFGVFKRLHGRDIPGTGIGLAICQRVVERQGGTIWVESELGKGATFFFTWPVVSTKEDRPLR